MASPSTQLDYAHPTLRREIGLFGAVMLGLGSILGTGVFVSLAHATELAGPWVLVAIVLAGLLAYCNAMSSAQLAAAYPVSGGTYEYGYRVLNPALGFTAGWMFLLAKSASAATAALGCAWYVIGFIYDRHGNLDARFSWLLRIWPGELDPYQGLAIVSGFALVVLISILTLAGLRRTNVANIAIVTFTVLALVFLIVANGSPAIDHYQSRSLVRDALKMPINPRDVGNAVALCFVAFTGYGRLATLGEEVHHPRSTIPKAISICLFLSVLLYLGVGALEVSVFPDRFDVFYRHSNGVVYGGPLSGIVALYNHSLVPVVTLAAVTAMLGVLLNLILGLSRVWLAMGRRGDMPRILARVNEKTSTPVPATILTGVLIALLVLVGDVRTTWSFSAFTVLIYYAITNLACLRLAPEHRRYPRALAWVGLFACLSLAWFVEMKVWIAGTILIAVGLIWHHLRRPARTEIA